MANNSVGLLGGMMGLEDEFIFVLYAVIFFFVVKYIMKIIAELRMPPGPLLNFLPIFGYLLFLGAKEPPYVQLARFSDKYGRIFRIKLGNKNMVVIGDPKLLREVFKRNDVTDRPHSPLNDGLMDGYGISSAEGKLWRTQRQFAHTCLRDAGFLKSSVKNKLHFEENAGRAIDGLIKELVETEGKAIDIERMLSFAVANIFFAIVVTKTFDHYEPELMHELDGLTDSFRILENISIANFIPIFCYEPRVRKVLKTVLQRRENTRNFFRKIIKEHRETMDENCPRDIIDSFLIQMDKNENEKKGEKSYFSEIQLLSVLGDLFSAGTETTKTTLRWLLLALARQPHIQEKAQKELDDVIGRNRMPTLDDRSNLPYMEATIQETLRISSIVPMGNPHCPSRDITIDGYHIPKGTMVTGLLWQFHRNSKVWASPQDFDPNHFLCPDGKSLRSEYLIPFSTGRRICLGEDVARNEVFLIAASLLQKFRFVPDESETLPTLEQTRGGFLRTPMSYNIKALPRFIF